jgi:hypothetical protein
MTDRSKQVEAIKSAIQSESEIDIQGQFDDLVDYLRDRGYDIVKKQYRPTSKDDIESLSEKLFDRNDIRSADELIRWMKRISKNQDVEPQKAFQIFGEIAIRRAASSGDSKDFAEIIEYTKAGHAFLKQTQENE